jgi:HSP20 family molecular chaperone IbpA
MIHALRQSHAVQSFRGALARIRCGVQFQRSITFPSAVNAGSNWND